MKGAIAAFVAAAAEIPDHPGTLSLIITGDEEGPATYGTVALMDWMAARDVRPDLCLVGEPTSAIRLGDTIKIGRRGSVNMWITVDGVQGHVAYPHLADNPIPRLVKALGAIAEIPLDDGSQWFQPSNLEITDIEVGNMATNVIPSSASARLNIRFNNLQSGAALVEHVRSILLANAPNASLAAKVSGEAFLTEPGLLSDLVVQAIRAETGIEAELSTSGGTSDARFLSKLCPVVEFGFPMRPCTSSTKPWRSPIWKRSSAFTRVSSDPRSAQDDIERAGAAVARMCVADGGDACGMARISQPVPDRRPNQSTPMRSGILWRLASHDQQHPNTIRNRAVKRLVQRRMRARQIMPVQIDRPVRLNNAPAEAPVPAAIQGIG